MRLYAEPKAAGAFAAAILALARDPARRQADAARRRALQCDTVEVVRIVQQMRPEVPGRPGPDGAGFAKAS